MVSESGITVVICHAELRGIIGRVDGTNNFSAELYFCSLYNGRGRFSNARSMMLLDANAAENRKKFFTQFEIRLVAKGKEVKRTN